MTEHIHGCLNCRPDMVPDLDRDDPRYHDGQKCGSTLRATVDGVVPGYHKGVFEGPDGWVLLACEGFEAGLIHECPNCTTRGPAEEDGYRPLLHHEVCVEPRFGHVEVIHDCPSVMAARVTRLKEALKPLVPEATYFCALFGRDVY
jgi:hypothetical protein